jgi:hypothetical protein
MTRTRSSAKAAGSRFERGIADFLATTIDDRIDRRVKTGAADKGDIGGLRFKGYRIVLECKNHARLNLAGWYAEATAEKQNDGAILGAVVHKRYGNAKPEDQWVTMTLGDLATLVVKGNA